MDCIDAELHDRMELICLQVHGCHSSNLLSPALNSLTYSKPLHVAALPPSCPGHHPPLFILLWPSPSRFSQALCLLPPSAFVIPSLESTHPISFARVPLSSQSIALSGPGTNSPSSLKSSQIAHPNLISHPLTPSVFPQLCAWDKSQDGETQKPSRRRRCVCMCVCVGGGG